MRSYVVRKGRANTSSRESLTNSRQTLAQKTGYAPGNSTSAILSLSGVEFDKGYKNTENIHLDVTGKSREQLIKEREEYRKEAKTFFTTAWKHLKETGYTDIIKIREKLNEHVTDLKKLKHGHVTTFVEKIPKEERKGNTFHKDIKKYIRENWNKSMHDPEEYGLLQLKNDINSLKKLYGAKAKLTKPMVLKDSGYIYAYKLEKWLRQAIFVLMHVATYRAKNDPKQNEQAELFYKASIKGENRNELAYLCTKAIRNMNKKEAKEGPEGRHSSHKEEKATPGPQETSLVKEKKKKGKKGKGKPQAPSQAQAPAAFQESERKVHAHATHTGPAATKPEFKGTWADAETDEEKTGANEEGNESEAESYSDVEPE